MCECDVPVGNDFVAISGGYDHNVALKASSHQTYFSIAKDKTNIDFGDTSESEMFQVWNDGMEILDYSVSISEGAQYFSVSPTSGSSTSFLDKISHNVSIDRSDIFPGDIVTGNVRISASGAEDSPQYINLSASEPSQPILTVEAVGNGIVEPTTGTYDMGEIITIVATPDSGYRVKTWTNTDDDFNIDPNNTVTMNSDKTIIVVFEPIPVRLFVEVIEGEGTIDPNGGIFDMGTTLTLTALPEDGYGVKGWYDANNVLLSTDPTIEVLMDSDKTINVEFERIPSEIEIAKMVVKASKIRGEWASDSFVVSGNIYPEGLGIIANPVNNGTDIHIEVIHDANSIACGHTETLNPDLIKIDAKRRKLSYIARIKKGERGCIKNFKVDLIRGSYSIIAKDVNLSGLCSPVLVKITIGDYYGVGMARDAIDYLAMGIEHDKVTDTINGRKSIPMRLLSGIANSLRVDKCVFRLGKGRKEGKDYLMIQGAIAIEDDSINIASENIVVGWGDPNIVELPANDLYQIGYRKVFKYKKPRGVKSSIAAALFNLENCTFRIIIRNADIGLQANPVDFDIQFDNFNETVPLQLTRKNANLFVYP